MSNRCLAACAFAGIVLALAVLFGGLLVEKPASSQAWPSTKEDYEALKEMADAAETADAAEKAAKASVRRRRASAADWQEVAKLAASCTAEAERRAPMAMHLAKEALGPNPTAECLNGYHTMVILLSAEDSEGAAECAKHLMVLQDYLQAVKQHRGEQEMESARIEFWQHFIDSAAEELAKD